MMTSSNSPGRTLRLVWPQWQGADAAMVASLTRPASSLSPRRSSATLLVVVSCR